MKLVARFYKETRYLTAILSSQQRQNSEMRVNLNNKDKYRPKQNPVPKMDTYRTSQVQHLRQYIVAIQNQLKSFEGERKTLLDELSKFESANSNMRLEIDYLVNQLKRLDVMIDDKNGETQKLQVENVVYEQELRQLKEMLREKAKQVQSLEEGVRDTEVTSLRHSRESKMDREILEIKLRSQIQQQLQPKIQSLAQQIHALKLQLSQRDFAISNLEQRQAKKTQSLNESDRQLAQKQLFYNNVSARQIEQLKQQLSKAGYACEINERQIESLKHSLSLAEQRCQELTGDDTVKKELINEQQRVVLVDNVALKKEKQMLVGKLEHFNAEYQSLTKETDVLKGELLSIHEQNAFFDAENSAMRIQLDQVKNKLNIRENDSVNLTQQNQTLRGQNVRLFTANEQLQKSIFELKNQKQLPRAQYESLKAKLQTRLQETVEKQEQLKKRHWLQIARYANQIDKLKADLEERNKELNGLKKQVKEQHCTLTSKEIANQSSVIIYESEKEAIRIQLAHEWKEKVDQESLKLQQDINSLKTVIEEHKLTIGKMNEELKHKDEIITAKEEASVKRQRDIELLEIQISKIGEELTHVKGRLDQSQHSYRDKQNHTRSLQAENRSRDETIALKLSEIQSLQNQLQQKDNEISLKDKQIGTKQNMIRFKEDELLRKQNDYEMEKQIMNNILQTQIKEALNQRQLQIQQMQQQINEQQIKKPIHQQLCAKTQTIAKQQQTINEQLQQIQTLRKYRQQQSSRQQQLDSLREHVEEATRSSKSLGQDLNQAHLLNQRQNYQIGDLKNIIEKMSQDQAQSDASALKQTQSIQAKDNETIQMLKSEHSKTVRELQQQISQLNQQINKKSQLDHQNTEFKESIAEHELKCLQLQEKCLQLQNDLAKVQKLLDDSHVQLKAQRNANIQMEAELLASKAQHKGLSSAYRQLEQQLNSARSQRPNYETEQKPSQSTGLLEPSAKSMQDVSERQSHKNQQLQKRLPTYEQDEIEHLEEVNSLKIQLENITNELIESDAIRDQLNKKIQAMNKELKLKDSQVKQLREWKELRDKQALQVQQVKQLKQKQAKQVKQQKQLNQQSHMLKIRKLQTQLKAKASQLQTKASQFKAIDSLFKQQQNLLHQKELECLTFESELKSKSDQLQQLQELLILKDEQINQLTLKANALEIKYNSFFYEIQKRTKDQEEANIFNHKKIAHLHQELQESKRAINHYQQSFVRSNQTVDMLKNQLLQKDAKIQILERHAECTKKHHEIMPIKPQTVRDSLQTDSIPVIPQLTIMRNPIPPLTNLSNYKRIMQKQSKSNYSQLHSPKPQPNSQLSRKSQQMHPYPQKASERGSEHNNANMDVSLNSNDFAAQFYSLASNTSTPTYHNTTLPQFFTSFGKQDHFNALQHEEDYKNVLSLHQSYQNDPEDSVSPKNFFANQSNASRHNKHFSHFSIGLQNNPQMNNQVHQVPQLRFGEVTEQKMIEKNKQLFEKSKSQKFLKNQINAKGNATEEPAQSQSKANYPSSIRTMLNGTNQPIKPTNIQKNVKIQQKQPKYIQSDKKPVQKNGGIRKNIAQQNQKVLNMSHQKINSKDVQQKVNDDSELPVSGIVQKGKLIRTMKSNSEMIKAQKQTPIG